MSTWRLHICVHTHARMQSESMHIASRHLYALPAYVQLMRSVFLEIVSFKTRQGHYFAIYLLFSSVQSTNVLTACTQCDVSLVEYIYVNFVDSLNIFA